jgi:PPM family protein phosphatase
MPLNRASLRASRKTPLTVNEVGAARLLIEEWLRRPTRQTGLSDVPDILASIGTTIGRVRTENQDRAILARFTHSEFPKQSFLACVICDGMGGMAEGSRCAEIAVAAFLDSLMSSPHVSATEMRLAAQNANDLVYDAYKGRGGTTLVALVFGAIGGVTAVTVGDSRLHEISASGALTQISTDDTIAGELRRLRGAPPADPEEFANRLAQFIGIGGDLDPRTYTLDSRRASAYLLTTDGIHTITPATINDVIEAAPSQFLAVSRLVNLSRWCGGKDNASAICVQTRAPGLEELRRRRFGATLELWDSFMKLELLIPAQNGRAQDQKQPLSGSLQEPPRPAAACPPRSGKQKRKRQSRPAERVPNSNRTSSQGKLEIKIVETRPDAAAKQDAGNRPHTEPQKHSPPAAEPDRKPD